MQENFKCKICETNLQSVLNLGKTPLANSLLEKKTSISEEFDLHLLGCPKCKNLQLSKFISADLLYKEYLYITPDSSMLSNHYDFLIKYLLENSIITASSFAVEIGCNAGQFLEKLDKFTSKTIGVDPASNIVDIAEDKGLKIYNEFFNESIVNSIINEHGKANTIIARHCFAHNEFPHEMVRAAGSLLSDDGSMVIENAYALNTIMNGEFDQIYHEHMYYYSLKSLNALFNLYGFEIVDATIGMIHGGSIVAVAKRKGLSKKSPNLLIFEELEKIYLNDLALKDFAVRCKSNIENITRLVTNISQSGKTIYSYGATAKGNTLLNSAGLDSNIISACVDSTSIKQGKFLPGSTIPIISEEEASENWPDFYFLTAWNYRDEIISKVRSSGNYHTRFIIPFPNVHIN